MQTNEQPTYVLPQNKKRAFIPKIFSLIVLGIIFYLGILLNVSLLELNASQETITRIVSLVLVLAIMVLGVSLAFHRSQQKYYFYRNRIVFIKKTVYYINILNTSQKQDILDKIFKSYSVNLGNGFFLKHIDQQIQLGNYLQQMINYAKTNS